MAHDPALDPSAILATFGIEGASSITPVTGGADTSIWQVQHRDHAFALRVFRKEQVATYRRELVAMTLAADAKLPVPTVHDTVIWRGRPALLLSWCSGRPLGEILLADPWRAEKLGRRFGRMLACIHRVSASELGAPAGGDWIGWAGIDEQPLKTQLRRIAGGSTALLHLDYHFLNVLSDGDEITAVLDWANARCGDPRADPRADVARSYTISKIQPYGPGRQEAAFTILRRRVTRAWRSGYEEVAGPLLGMPPSMLGQVQ